MASGGSRPGAGRRRKDPALALTAAERSKLPTTAAGGTAGAVVLQSAPSIVQAAGDHTLARLSRRRL